MNYPNPHGYRPPPSSGTNVLVIVLIVIAVLLVLGGAGCLLCVGIAATASDTSEAPTVTTSTPIATPPTLPTATPLATATPTTVTPTARPRTPVPTQPRVVSFVCPPGKKPGGAVRAGCLCGNDIIGTACGAPGNFTDVTETPTGCRFVCN